MVRLKPLLAALALVVVTGLSNIGTARAATPTPIKKRPVGGVTISPAFQQIAIGQSEDSKDGQIKLTNNTGEPLEFAISVTDFGSLDETGGVAFIGKDQKALNYRYGLTSWLTLEQDRVVVDPKATKVVPFTIDNKESMAPGGHYGAIMVTPTQTGQDPSKVDVNQILTSLLFVNKQGGDVYKLGIQDVSIQHSLLSAPSTVSLRFQNAGNVHVIPRGVLTITDPRGVEVKQGVINDGSAIILPQAFRQLKAPLLNLGSAWMPGRYHLSIAYRYEGESSVQYYNSSFYYVNGWYIIALVLLLAIVLGLVLSKQLRKALRDSFKGLARRVKFLYPNRKKL
jgi:hypothetical protein